MAIKNNILNIFSRVSEKFKFRESATRAILFADTCRSTEIFERYGDVRAREILAKTLSILIDVITEKDGEVVKTIGDEVMATFMKCEQVVYAACDMQKRVKEDEMLSQHHISIKVGFHYGDVLIERHDVFGDAVNVAARMVNLSKGDQIITTLSTVQKLPDYLRTLTRKLGPTKVRGKQEDIEISEVIWQEDMSLLTRLPMDREEMGQHVQEANLVLIYRKKKIDFAEKRSSFSMGRGPQNELQVSEELASRYHAKIEFRNGKYILTDQSTNGTYVWMENREEYYLHREEMPLYGQGVISLGRAISKDNPEFIYYKVT